MDFTCPRCFFTCPSDSGMRYCPRCGMAGAAAAWADGARMDITVGGAVFRVLDRIAIGSISSVYRCRLNTGHDAPEGVCKIARDPCTNRHIETEARVLRELAASDGNGEFLPFVPRIEASFAFGSAPARQANVLRMDDAIHSPDELYTLSEVRSHYPEGLDARDVAWIWRRLLSLLGFLQSRGCVHGAVLPMHVMIEPREHKLVLVDWCCASIGSRDATPLAILAGGYFPWYKRSCPAGITRTPALDVALGARCMIELLGGDPVGGVFPPTVDPAIARHLGRCLDVSSSITPDPWKLLGDFDRLIEVLWGPRKFRVLSLPPKRPVADAAH